jgi:hypothetical protein
MVNVNTVMATLTRESSTRTNERGKVLMMADE